RISNLGGATLRMRSAAAGMSGLKLRGPQQPRFWVDGVETRTSRSESPKGTLQKGDVTTCSRGRNRGFANPAFGFVAWWQSPGKISKRFLPAAADPGAPTQPEVGWLGWRPARSTSGAPLKPSLHDS